MYSLTETRQMHLGNAVKSRHIKFASFPTSDTIACETLLKITKLSEDVIIQVENIQQ